MPTDIPTSLPARDPNRDSGKTPEGKANPDDFLMFYLWAIVWMILTVYSFRLGYGVDAVQAFVMVG